MPTSRTPIVFVVAFLVSCPLTVAQFGSKIQYFPQFAINGSARTIITMHNPGQTVLTVDVTLTRSDGSPLHAEQVTVQPGATGRVVYGDPAESPLAGWARLSSDVEFVATLLYRIEGVGNVGVLPSPEAKAMKIMTFVGAVSDTGFAVANPSETVTSKLTFQVYDEAGQLLREAPLTLGPHEHRAFFLSESPYEAEGRGLVTVLANEPVVALALRLDGSLLSSVGVVVPGLPIRADWNDESPNIIGGCQDNTVAPGTVGGTIGGGGNAGFPNRVASNYGTVGGGVSHTAGGSFSTVSGGRNNVAGGDRSTVGGGNTNRADGNVSTVAGGENNTATGAFSTLGGGNTNAADGENATVGGGALNTAVSNFSTVSGGNNNTAGSIEDEEDFGIHATVSGGTGNRAITAYSTVCGGHSNTAGREKTQGSSYGGAQTVGGGWGNEAVTRGATVGGGESNRASGQHNTIGGGYRNETSGTGATVPGGYENFAHGHYAFAAGQDARALHSGTFVWNDFFFADEGPFESTAQNQFLISAAGGVGINTNSPQGALDVHGSIYQRGNSLHADYVFEPDYRLESIEEHSSRMWAEKRLPAFQAAQKDDEGRDVVEYGSRMRDMLEELEKAHVYIDQLNRRLQRQEEAIADLNTALADLQARDR
jgi:hypothetical protein